MEDKIEETTTTPVVVTQADRRHLFGKRFSATQGTLPDIPDEGILVQTLFAGVRQLPSDSESQQERSFSTGESAYDCPNIKITLCVL